MNDNIIGICDDEINAEEIMQKIREKVFLRKTGEISQDPDESILSFLYGRTGGELNEQLQHDLTSVNSSWDIQNSGYRIRSHHKFFGKFLVRGRELVHGEVRRYVDPVFFQQTRFNASTVRLLVRTFQLHEEHDKAISRLKQETDQELKDAIDSVKTESDARSEARVHELESKFTGELELKTRELESRTETRARELFSQIDADIRTKASLAHVLEERIQKGWSQKGSKSSSTLTKDTNYFLFEERFRGSREDIKKRQLSFLPYFVNCSSVLDIGCGRGEFLEILRENDISGVGVDIDADMVAFCRSRKLNVDQSDAIAYLEKVEDKSLDGIFIDQVAEHLEPENLFRLLALCYQKLKYGYYIVVETVNPLSFVSFVNFYIDLTHKKPLHPQTLEFLISTVGFRENEKKFFSPVSDESRLKKIPAPSGSDVSERVNVDIYNNNIDMLNSVLFGAQDYAVIGKK